MTAATYMIPVAFEGQEEIFLPKPPPLPSIPPMRETPSGSWIFAHQTFATKVLCSTWRPR